MIQVQKSFVRLPKILADRGKRESDQMLLDWDAHLVPPGKPVPKFEISSSVYGAKSVKFRLLVEQFGKCAFCEGKMWSIRDGKPYPIQQHGDVEHYRPKGNAKQDDADVPTHPGYFWLAYDWSNLYMACAICNQVYKKDLFPLADPAKRAFPRGDILLEDAMIVSPGEDPSPHLEFDMNIVKSRTPRGAETVRRTGLDRPGLNDDRRDHLNGLQHHIDSLKAFDQMAVDDPSLRPIVDVQISRIKKLLWDHAEPQGKYSMCVRSFLEKTLTP